MTQRTPSQPGASAPPTAARRRRNLWSRLLATVVGCLVSLLIAEVVVRSFVKVRNVGPSFTVADPVLGKRLKKNLACERITPEFRMRLRTNSDGWRGPESDGSPTCVLFLGDSFTLGYGVDDGQEYPQLVGKTLGETVVNMGIGDNGNARWRRLLRELPERSAPRAVVLQLCSNDFDDNLAEGLATLGADGGIVEHAPAPPSMLRRAQGLIDLVPGLAYSHLVGLAGQLNYQHAAPAQGAAASAPPAAEHPGLKLTLALLGDAIATCRQRGWFVVVLCADCSEAGAAPLAKLCLERTVPFVRMPSKSESPGLYYVVDGHWTAAGHRRAAELLVPLLRK